MTRLGVLLFATSMAAAAAGFPPVAAASVSPDQAWVGQPVQLSSAGSIDPDASPLPLSFSWDFGDGSALSNDPNPAHAYARSGAFVATLTVFDGEYTAVASATVTVLAPPTTGRPTRSGPLALDSSSSELWVVNPDSNSVSVVALGPGTPVAEIPVGREPRSVALSNDGARAFVACADDDAVWVIDRRQRSVQRRLPLGRRPFGVAAIPGTPRIAVTHETDGTLVVVDPEAPASAAALGLGGSPRALAVTQDGRRAFITHFLTRAGTGRVSVVDLGTAALAGTVDLVEDPGPDTPSSGRGFPNLLGAIAIEPSGEGVWIGGLKSNTGRGLFVDGQPLVPANRLRGLMGWIDAASLSEPVARRIDTEDADSVTGIAFSPDGRYGFALHQGSGRLSVYDLPATAAISRGDGATIQHLARVDLGEAPHGIAIDAGGTRAYVANYLSRDVSIVDIRNPGAPLVVQTVAVTAEPLPAAVARGKRLFYRSREPVHSLQSYIACASCHPDGSQDGRTWDFTQSGEGLRNTIDLRGRGGMAHGPVHWSANFDEIQDFENDIVHGFGGTGLAADGQPPYPPLAAQRNAGRSQALDDLAAYVASLVAPPRSPHRAADGSLTEAARRGQDLFYDPAVGCASCHRPPRFTDSTLTPDPADFILHDVGTLQAGSGQRLGARLRGLDTPTLIGVWTSPPYLHDGSAASLREVLTSRNAGDRHGVTAALEESQLDDLIAFLQSLEGAEDEIREVIDPPRAQTCGCSSAGPLFLLAAPIAVLTFHRRRRRRTAPPSR